MGSALFIVYVFDRCAISAVKFTTDDAAVGLLLTACIRSDSEGPVIETISDHGGITCRADDAGNGAVLRGGDVADVVAVFDQCLRVFVTAVFFNAPAPSYDAAHRRLVNVTAAIYRYRSGIVAINDRNVSIKIPGDTADIVIAGSVHSAFINAIDDQTGDG